MGDRGLAVVTLVPASSRGPISDVLVEGPQASGDTTGVTDTGNLQAAINQAAAVGGTLILPAGSFTVSNLTAPADGLSVAILGAGPNRTFIGAASTATGILLDMTYSSAQPLVNLSGFSLHLTNSRTMTALRTNRTNWLSLSNLNFRYGAIGWQHVQTSGTGPFDARYLNFQNQTTEAINLTGSSGLGSAGEIHDVFITVTDNTVTLTQGILVDWFTVGVMFQNVQILGNTASSLNIHTGITYNTAAPSGLQGAFLYFTNCVTDQMDTGHGLDLTNARGIWATGNFWSTSSAASGTYGVNINAGKEQFYVNDWISGAGMQFTNAPDKITIGSGCRFPQTQAGQAGGLALPASNPPTNMIVSNDALFYTSITNRVGSLATACGHGFGWLRGGTYT